MNWFDNILNAIKLCPDYIGKGILQLIVLTLGGIIVAWITTKVFGRKSEINAVEGVLLKRKLDIYETLSGKLEELKAVVLIPSDLYQSAVMALKKEKVTFNAINQNQILGVFDSPEKLTTGFLDLENYIASKKLYYDNDVMIQTMRFQNYFAALRRLLVIFEEQFVDAGIQLEKKEVASAERLLTVEMGLLLQDEFLGQIDKVISAMKQSIKHLSFKHRDEIEYKYSVISSPDGPIMSELMNTKLFSERETILGIVTKATAFGMADSIMKGKKK